jgi:hypothetical protein
MASRVEFDWRGDEIIAAVEHAAIAAVNEVVDEAADDARSSHTWLNRTGQLEEEIVAEHDVVLGDGNPLARFGTTRRRGFYGLFHELGTVNEFARPFLRPAADRAFPTLAAKIRRRLNLR